QTDLVTTVGQINMLKMASCDCGDKAAHKPDPAYVKQANADLKKSLAALASRWKQTEKEYDEVVQVYDEDRAGEISYIQPWEETLEHDATDAEGTVRLEAAQETRERLAKMIASVLDIGKYYALEAWKKQVAVDCSEEMRRVASELEKELGYDRWFKLNAKEYIYTVPTITKYYLEVMESRTRAAEAMRKQKGYRPKK
ncbi:hypothetical protein PMAYCL1PPCAC_04569, partial [Pristionchus mayeri]